MANVRLALQSRIQKVPTVQDSGDPVQDGTPKVDPSHELEVVWTIWLSSQDGVYCAVEDGDRAWGTVSTNDYA
jgi:hypothetical protein